MSYKQAVDALKPFIETHAGTYAMGKGATIAAFETDSRFIRLDGPAADANLQTLLKNQTDINAVFKQYGIDWYIGINLTKQDSGCYGIREPKQNSFGTNKSLQGWMCKTPVAEISASPTLKLQIFNVEQK